MARRWSANKIEEYVIKTHELLARRWKKKGKLGNVEEVEIGEPPLESGKGELALSNVNPVFFRQDALEFFSFRVRNLFNYDKNMFSIEVDSHGKEAVLRTTNKKYFKRFSIGDLQRAGIKLDPANFTFEFANNTLIIYYKKPSEILSVENQKRTEFERLNKQNPQEGDLECSTQ